MKNLTIAQHKQLKVILSRMYATFHKDGTITVRNSFHWYNEGGVVALSKRAIEHLTTNGFTASIHDTGTQHVPFRGGDNTKKGQGSFYWVRLENFDIVPEHSKIV